MTTPSDHDNWWKLYLPNESRWKDLGRVLAYFIPIFLLNIVATAYAFGYAFIHVEEWAPNPLNPFTYYLFLLRLSVVILLPVILMLAGWHFIFQQVHEFVSHLYDSESVTEKLTSLIRRRLFGVPHFPPPLGAFIKYPFLRIEDTTLDQGHWARWLGGPAILVIHDGIAVYVERGNQFSRILGPGEPMPLLERYERIKQIIDLKPQIKTGDVTPWTKDGIPIKLNLRAELQINASDEAFEKSHKFRFPFDPLAVKTAVETVSVNIVDGKLNEQSWLDGAWGTVNAFVNGFVAGHSLDELLLAPHAENHTNSNHHSQEAIEQILSREISNQVTEKIQSALRNNGAKILDLQITSVEVPPEIDELRTKYRESVKQKIAAQRNSRAEAEHIRVREQAHAEAQRTMLMTIIKRLENVPPDQLTEALTLSLSGLLDQGLDDSLIRPLLAKESFAVLERIQKMLNEKF